MLVSGLFKEINPPNLPNNSSWIVGSASAVLCGCGMEVVSERKKCMPLTDKLIRRRKASRRQSPADKLAVMDRTTKELASSGIVKRCLKDGDPAPDFILLNLCRQSVSLAEMLKRGPVVLSFYRGGW